MSADIAEPEHLAERTGSEWQWGWALAVAVNLPVPFGLGALAVAKSGVFGMFAGVVVFWLAGAVVIARVPAVRAFAVRSALFFALSQIVPFAQFLAGASALELFARSPDSMSEPTAFLVTVTTGALLLAAALTCGLLMALGGWLLEWMFGSRPQDCHPV